MQTETQPDTSALAEYDQPLRLNPDSAEAYFNRGVARGSNPGAIEDFDEAIRLNPDFANAYFHRACLKDYLVPRIPYKQRTAAHHDALCSAIADYDTAIRLTPDRPDLLDAYYRRGMVKYDIDQYEAAIVDFDEALRLKLGAPECLIAEVQSWRKEAEGILNFYEEGIVRLDEKIRQNPDDISTYKIRGETKGFLGRMQEAKADFQKILKIITDTQVIAEIQRHLQKLDEPYYWQQYGWRTGNET